MTNNRKMKVVIGINDFCIGGAQTLLLKQFKYFNIDKFEFYLISLFELKHKTSLHNLIPNHIRVFRFYFRGFLDVKNWWKLFKLLKEIKPDIIVSSLFFANTIFRILKIFLKKCKSIIIEHNTYINKTKFQIFVDRTLSKITYKIIAVSDEVINFTSKQEKISKSKFVTIFNGIDLEEIEKFKEVNQENILQFRRELGFTNDDKIIINVARLTPQKRIDLLIDAFNKLNRINDNYKLIILGEGVLKDQLTQKIKNLGLEDSVFLLGAKKDIYEYYMISDLFVLTSKIEGFALVCIEAMAFNIPVISTRVAGPDKYIKDYYNGFLTEHNIKDIVEKILLFSELSIEELNIYKKNCLSTAKQFDIRNNVKKYENLFIECLKV